MSGIIDSNIVQMVLDNTLFQKNAEQTLSTLDKLKDALNFEGAVRGIENLGENIRNAGMDKLYNGVYTVQEGFNALDVVATRVLQNITDRVQGLITQLANDALIKPLKEGFAEYELQMNSVQTIMSSTGQSVGTVNAYLDELNEYADRTIYSFSDMTSNIGKFTNAGVSLDKAVAAIQGVSNVAAISGANTNEASRAMYNFAQALSAGSVKLIDWKSIENANMATVGFKESLIETAVAMGTLRKEGDKYISTTTDANGKVSEAFNATSMFNDSLSSQWMTTEVLVQTLQQYSSDVRTMSADQKKAYEDQLRSLGYTEEQIAKIEELGIKAANAAKDVKTFSQLVDTIGESLGSGWTKTWQLIFGDLNEAKVLWTAVNDVVSGFIDKTADARNAILETWHKSGYTYNQYGELVKAFYDAQGRMVEKLPEDGKVFDQYGKEVEAVVDQETGELVPQIVENGEKLREEMGGRDFLLGGLANVFEVLSNAADQFGQSWNRNFLGINNGELENISITGQKLVDLSRDFYDVTEDLKKAWSGDATALDKFEDVANTLAENSIYTNIERFGQSVDGSADKMSKYNKVFDRWHRLEGFDEAKGKLGQLRDSFDTLTSALRSGFNGISDVFASLVNVFDAFFHSSFISFDSLNSGIGALAAVTTRIEAFGAAIKKHLGADEDGGNREGLMKFFSGLQGVLESTFWVKLDFITNAFDAIGKVFEHIIGPGRTIADILGSVGDNMSKFAHALDFIFNTENGSKLEPLFNSLAEGFNNFFDTIKQSVDFSGITNLFNTIIEVIGDKDVKIFDTIANGLHAIVYVLEALMGIASPIIAAAANVIGPLLKEIGIWINQISVRLSDFAASLRPSEEVMAALQHAFEGIFNIVKAVAEVIMNVSLAAWDALTSIIGSFLPSGEELSTLLTNWGDHFNGIAEIISSLVSGEDGVPTLSELIGKITEKFISFFGSLKDINLLEKFSEFIKKIGDGIKHALGGTEDMTLLDTIIDKIKGFLDKIKAMLSDDSGNLDLVKVLEAGGIGVAIKKVMDFIKDLKNKTNDFGGILSFLKEFKEILGSFAENFEKGVKAESVKAIAMAILEIAAAMFVISMIDTPALIQAVIAMSAMFQMIERVLVILSSLDKGKVLAGAGAITAMGTAMLQMAIAVAVVGNMGLANAIQGVVAIGVMLDGIIHATEQLSKISNDIPKVAGAMIALAVALDLLIIPVKILGGMDIMDLVKGMLALGIMMDGLVITAKDLSKHAVGMTEAGTGMVLMAVGVRILAGAVKSMAGLEWSDVAKGLVVMAAGLTAMVAAAAIVDKGDLEFSLIQLGAAMLMLGGAMMALSIAGHIMQGVEWETLGKMGAVLAVALIALGVASYAINGANLLMIAGAIDLVATAFLKLNVALGLAQLIGPICTSIAAAIQGVSSSLQSFAGSAARDEFLTFLQDLILFIPKLIMGVVQSLAEMVGVIAENAGKIVEGIVTIGQALITGLVQILPNVFDLIRTTIAQVIQTLIEAVPQLFALLTTFFDQLWPFLSEQVPNLFDFLTLLIEQLLTFLQENGMTIAEAIFTFITDFFAQAMEFLTTNSEMIANTLLEMLNILLDTFNKGSDAIIKSLLQFLLNLLTRLAEFAPQMADKALTILLAFIRTVIDHLGDIVNSAVEIALAFMRGITEKMPEIVDTAFKMVIGFINGLADAIRENHQLLFDAIWNLITAIAEAIVDGIKTIANAAIQLIQGFLDEFDPIKIGQHLLNVGANLVQGIINGIADAAHFLWESVTNLAQGALDSIARTLGIASPSKKGAILGGYLVEGLVKGVHDENGSLINTVSDMAYGALDALSVLGNAQDFSPSLSPVISTKGIDANLRGYLDNVGDILTGTVNISSDIANQKLQMQTTLDALGKDSDYSTIINGMNDLHNDLSVLTTQLMRMNIVMDTGTMVGVLTPEIDKSLGQRQVYVGRGMM